MKKISAWVGALFQERGRVLRLADAGHARRRAWHTDGFFGMWTRVISYIPT